MIICSLEKWTEWQQKDKKCEFNNLFHPFLIFLISTSSNNMDIFILFFPCRSHQINVKMLYYGKILFCWRNLILAIYLCYNIVIIVCIIRRKEYILFLINIIFSSIIAINDKNRPVRSSVKHLSNAEKFFHKPQKNLLINQSLKTLDPTPTPTPVPTPTPTSTPTPTPVSYSYSYFYSYYYSCS